MKKKIFQTNEYIAARQAYKNENIQYTFSILNVAGHLEQENVIPQRLI